MELAPPGTQCGCQSCEPSLEVGGLDLPEVAIGEICDSYFDLGA
jgi:hypothetical protein